MSEGRLAPVREADRHAALIAGAAGGAIGCVTFCILHAVNVIPAEPAGQGSFLERYGSYLAAATAFGFLVGAIEGAMAARAARRAANRFMPLADFTVRVFVATALINALLVVVAASATYNGMQLAAAIFLAMLIVVAASSMGAAILGWSHSMDWPQIPAHFLRANDGARTTAPYGVPGDTSYQ